MSSIVNGLFAGRSGLSSHGSAIAVVGDNISNASTIGYKSSRAEFADLLSGGQTAGKIIGSGSQLAGVSTAQNQGTLEFTGRPLDLAIDGNGFFVVADGAQKFYTRAGNFKVDQSGYIINQDGYNVLGFPKGGSGALERININTVSQNNVSTRNVDIGGNVNAAAPVMGGAIPVAPNAGTGTGTAVTYTNLGDAAEFQTVVDVFDSLGAKHNVTVFFFRTGATAPQYTVNAYVNSEDVDPGASPTAGFPRLLASTTMSFGSNGALTAGGTMNFTGPWNNGSDTAQAIDVDFDPFTMYSAPSNIQSINQDGQGVGSVTSISIQSNGDIAAILDNGTSSIIGKIGMATFSSPDGLVRLGKNLLQQTPASGEPIIGEPGAGKFGTISAGSIELSTVDIAGEFVKLITLQRGFQANSRIITTINQLLNEIIQLA